MIGGPTDVVIESNIVRASSTAPRARRAAGARYRRHRRYAAACGAARRRRNVAAAAGTAPAARIATPPTTTPTPVGARPNRAPRAAPKLRRAHQKRRSRSADLRPISRAASAEPRSARRAAPRRGQSRRTAPPPVQSIPETRTRTSPKWRIGSKRRCAARAPTPPSRRRDRSPCAARRCARRPRGRAADHAGSSRSRPAPDAEPRPEHRHSGRPSTASNRRWRACSAVRQERRDDLPHPAAVFVLRRWWLG